MKKISTVFISASLISFSAFCLAADVDADSAQKMLKAEKCTKCHAEKKDKKATSYQKIAAKAKKESNPTQWVIEKFTKAHKVKDEDGNEDDHAVVKSKDSAAIENLAKYILEQ